MSNLWSITWCLNIFSDGLKFTFTCLFVMGKIELPQKHSAAVWEPVFKHVKPIKHVRYLLVLFYNKAVLRLSPFTLTKDKTNGNTRPAFTVQEPFWSQAFSWKSPGMCCPCGAQADKQTPPWRYPVPNPSVCKMLIITIATKSPTNVPPSSLYFLQICKVLKTK